MTQIPAGFVGLLGLAVVLLIADRKARSRTPSSGSTIAGHSPPQLSGRTGVEPQTLALVAAPPVPLTSVDVDVPHSTSTGLDSPLSPNLGGHGDGDPQASRARRAETLAGGVSSPVTSPASPQGDHRG